MKTRRFDAANYITSPEDVVEYLNAVLEENDPAALTQALGTIARSEGMTRIAEKTGLKREGLYKSLGEGGNPSFATVSKVLDACGLRLQITQSDDHDAVVA